jgi:hypothetical protein
VARGLFPGVHQDNCPGSESYGIFKTFPAFTNSKRNEHNSFCTVCTSDVNVSYSGNHGFLKHVSASENKGADERRQRP